MFWILLFCVPAYANDVYIAQTAAGGNTGADCADAVVYTYFNSAGNWVSSGPTGIQIGPGTIVHVCGTLTGSTGGSNLLQFQGSGTSGNQITLHFETGAIITSAAWGGGVITGNGLSYLTVDGGSNGIIQATANGTSLANQLDNGAGVEFTNVSHSEVKNLTIGNMYVHVCTYPISNCTDEITFNTVGIYFAGGSYDTIDNNTVHDAKGCIQFVGPGSATYSNWSITGNTAYHCSWGIQMGDSSDSMIMNPPVLIQNNHVYDGWNWDDCANPPSCTMSSTYHHDGIFIWENGAHSQFNQPTINANVVDGDWGQTDTSYLYIAGGSGTAPLGTIVQAVVTNNAFVNQATTTTHVPTNGNIYDWGYQDSYYNNTVVGLCSTSNNCSTGIAITGDSVTLKNNIFQEFTNDIGTTIAGSTAIASSDYNNFYNTGSFASVADITGTFYVSLANWKACTGGSCQTSGSPDANGTNANPNLNASSSPPFQLTSASGGAYHTGANLTSLSITPLDTDACGNSRPSSGAWDIGFCQYGSTPPPPSTTTAPCAACFVNKPAPPTDVTVELVDVP